MTIETTFEAQLISHTDNHWDIVSAHYEANHLHIEFQDGTRGSIPLSQFPELNNATEADFQDLQVSPCGVILENDRIEWDYAEAGLYKLVRTQRTVLPTG
ncbi:MAG: DUF2442 domain-containing protein [Phormidesmis sp.]